MPRPASRASRPYLRMVGHETVERQGVRDLLPSRADRSCVAAQSELYDALRGRVDRRLEEAVHLVVGDGWQLAAAPALTRGTRCAVVKATMISPLPSEA